MFSECRFGSVTYRRREYRSDIVVHVDGTVTPRRKEISRRKYGTSHVMAEEELEKLLEEEPDTIIIGSGVHGALETGFRSDATVLPTCEAIKKYNEERSAGRRVAAIIHVTC